MILDALYALLAALVVGVLWGAVIGSYAAVAALVTFLAVLVLAAPRGPRVP